MTLTEAIRSLVEARELMILTHSELEKLAAEDDI